jgi:hypothetical protein
MLTFAQAYAIVCPDGRPVDPDSQDFRDIQELMRQSGYVLFQDKLVKDLVPRMPKTVMEAMRFHERSSIEPIVKVSKRQWLSVNANRAAFLERLNGGPKASPSPPVSDTSIKNNNATSL